MLTAVTCCRPSRARPTHHGGPRRNERSEPRVVVRTRCLTFTLRKTPVCAGPLRMTIWSEPMNILRNTLAACAATLWLFCPDMASATESLYQRLGGYDAIAGFVDTAFPRVASNPQLTHLFRGHSVDSQRRQRQLIVDAICEASGGPCLYTGRDAHWSRDHRSSVDHIHEDHQHRPRFRCNHCDSWMSNSRALGHRDFHACLRDPCDAIRI